MKFSEEQRRLNRNRKPNKCTNSILELDTVDSDAKDIFQYSLVDE